MRNEKVKRTAMLLLLLIAASTQAQNEATSDNARARMKDSRAAGEEQEILNDASVAYRELINGPHGKVPQSVLSRSRCIAVVPEITTAAAVVGGSHGDGVVACRTSGSTKQWSNPVFVDLNAGSLGAQVGAKSTSLVLFFTNQDAVAAVKRGKFKLGADASVAAGTFDKAYDVGDQGVVAYQQSSGAYIGASVTGGQLSTDEQANRSYYGKEVDVTGLLEGKAEGITVKSNPLTTLFPQAS